jgi:hypothetical protein
MAKAIIFTGCSAKANRRVPSISVRSVRYLGCSVAEALCMLKSFSSSHLNGSFTELTYLELNV